MFFTELNINIFYSCHRVLFSALAVNFFFFSFQKILSPGTDLINAKMLSVITSNKRCCHLSQLSLDAILQTQLLQDVVSFLSKVVCHCRQKILFVCHKRHDDICNTGWISLMGWIQLLYFGHWYLHDFWTLFPIGRMNHYSVWQLTCVKRIEHGFKKQLFWYFQKQIIRFYLSVYCKRKVIIFKFVS
jgi:hypothetical protein